MILYSSIKWILLCLLFISLLIAVWTVVSDLPNNAIAADSKFTSKYTSIMDTDCWETPRDLTAYYDKRQLDANECPALKGWRLFTVFEPINPDSWIDIAYGDTLWSTEQVIKSEKGFGHSPSLMPGRIEWRILNSGATAALIFRISAIDNKNQKTPIPSRLFVFNLSNNIPRYCGTAKTNQEARVIADKGTTCSKQLPKVLSRLPKSDLSSFNSVLKKRPSLKDRSNSQFRNQHMYGGDVREVSKQMSSYLFKYDRSAIEYPAPKGWRLFEVSSQDYCWLDIVRGRTVWKTNQFISDVGPAAQIEGRIQWIMTKTGAPHALIFRVAAQNPDGKFEYISRLLVIGLEGNTPRFCGMAKTNLETKNIAEKAHNCTSILPMVTIPN